MLRDEGGGGGVDIARIDWLMNKNDKWVLPVLLQLLDHPLLPACPDSPEMKDNLESAPIGALIVTNKSVNTKKLEKQFEVQKRLLIAFL